MLISKTVIVKWNSKHKNAYENKGYIYTKMQDEFEVKVEDLSDCSHSNVLIKCDNPDCKDPYLSPTTWQSYKKCVREDGRYYCYRCAMKLYGSENYRLSRLKNGISFEDWCYKNLSKKDADEILLRWDYNLNVGVNGNKISPKEISYGSNGINGKGYYFMCLNHHEHVSELKNINRFTGGQHGSIDCNQCGKIFTTHPHLINYFVNEKHTHMYSAGTDVEVDMKCPDCGYIKSNRISTLTYQGFNCIRCGDGISYPEKFMCSVLEQLKLDFIPQLSKTTFDWCDKYKYDFYIPSINIIIETHGLQHYKEMRGLWNSLSEIQENDDVKESLASENKILAYIIINCSLSKLEFVKRNILNSRLNVIFDLSDIDWIKCHEYACSSLVKVACDLWNDKNMNISEISEVLKMHRDTIRSYLKEGAELHWCEYNPKDEMSKARLKMKEKLSVSVICLNTKEIFYSQTDAATRYNIASTHISRCCRNKKPSAGKHPETGESLKWKYHKNYLIEQTLKIS